MIGVTSISTKALVHLICLVEPSHDESAFLKILDYVLTAISRTKVRFHHCLSRENFSKSNLHFLVAPSGIHFTSPIGLPGARWPGV